jgi:hypothetical protein
MKKVLSLMLLAGMLSFYACGPSAEDKAAAEKVKTDSLAAVDKAKADADAAKRTADSAAKAQADTMAAKAARDSAAVKKGGKKGK